LGAFGPLQLGLGEDVADRVVVFGQDKRIADSGSAGEVLANRGLLDANNMIHGHRHPGDHGEIARGGRSSDR
jgi:hypothetical protein